MKKKQQHYCVLGLGVTGISCLGFLSQKKDIKLTATDNKDYFELQNIVTKFPQVNFFLGGLKIPEDVDILVVSPGIDLTLPVIKVAKSLGAKLTNDINLFLAEIKLIKKINSVRLIGITGTNGKTTVVNLLASMAEKCRIKYAMCGNVGIPVLDALRLDLALYIIELSSFQLELIDRLDCDVACILNITPDHLDRYNDFSEYCTVKAKIYQYAKNIVYYREDPNLRKNLYNNLAIGNSRSFGIDSPKEKKDFGISTDGFWLMKGRQNILPINQLTLLGKHNALNALACLAIGEVLEFSYDNMCAVLKEFSTLEHRYQVIGKFNDEVLWINDSKGTNVGATIAALNNNAGYYNKTILILGGVNKNADLSLLKSYLIKYCRIAILFGQCKTQLFNLFHNVIDCYLADSLVSVVSIAKEFAIAGDRVLFSPACASFDMFKDYKERGNLFKKAVLELYQI